MAESRLDAAKPEHQGQHDLYYISAKGEALFPHGDSSGEAHYKLLPQNGIPN